MYFYFNKKDVSSYEILITRKIGTVCEKSKGNEIFLHCHFVGVTLHSGWKQSLAT